MGHRRTGCHLIPKHNVLVLLIGAGISNRVLNSYDLQDTSTKFVTQNIIKTT